MLDMGCANVADFSNRIWAHNGELDLCSLHCIYKFLSGFSYMYPWKVHHYASKIRIAHWLQKSRWNEPSQLLQSTHFRLPGRSPTHRHYLPERYRCLCRHLCHATRWSRVARPSTPNRVWPRDTSHNIYTVITALTGLLIPYTKGGVESLYTLPYNATIGSRAKCVCVVKM